MSGIAGILRLDGGRAEEQDLLLMRDTLLHRGPDRQSMWREGPVGLIHNWLEIDPEPPQPCARGAFHLVLDGRIDNIPFLSQWLRLEPEQASAPEAVLAAYARRGAGAFPLLLGDFTLAVWDGKDERLILARDPIGLKPLYYFQDSSRFIFASEIKAILAVPGVPCRPDEARLDQFDRFRFRGMERTFFSGISRLGPGTWLSVGRSAGVRTETFWEPNGARKIRLADRDAYQRKFRELFLESVRCRLPRKGVAAIRLSGGLDSSSIAGACAYVRDHERRELSLRAVSIVSDAVPEADERRHIGAVCSAWCIERSDFLGESQDVLDGIEKGLYHQEAPLYEPMDPWILHQHRVAQLHGARVVLGGDWGDQVMGSTAHLADLVREGRWLEFWHEFVLYPKHEGGYYRDLLDYIFWYLILPMRVSGRYEAVKHVLRRAAMPWRPIQRMGPKFPTAYQRESYEAVFGIHNVLLLESLEKMAAQCGVEARLPFLDRRIVMFKMSVPWREITRDGLSRRLEREALEGMLLPSIAARKDKGDATRLETLCLHKAGCKGDDGSALDEWRKKLRRIWEDEWIRKKGNIGKNTRPRVLSSTAT